MDKIKFLVFFLSISVLFTGCSLVANQSGKTVCAIEEQECANDLISNCSPGTIQQLTHQLVIKGEESGKCIMDFEYVPTEGVDNPLVGYKMTCNVPISVKNIDAFNEYLAKDQFQSCNGNLKEKLDQQANRVQEAKQNVLDKTQEAKQRALEKLQEYEDSL